jgi:hypothetical protein
MGIVGFRGKIPVFLLSLPLDAHVDRSPGDSRGLGSRYAFQSQVTWTVFSAMSLWVIN